MIIKNIKWDVNKEDEYYTAYLPSEETVSLKELTSKPCITEEELCRLVGDWLSDRWGYCHYDFEIQLEENEKNAIQKGRPF